MFFDIETSPNLVLTWRAGFKINISHENIIEERKVICIAWNWEGESKVHSLTWDKKQNDKSMLKRFIGEMKRADELVAQNGDRFDIKWIRTRALYHRLDCPPDFISVDTLKLARSGFYFNSNRLDYISKFLGYKGKIKTDFDLWKNIVLHRCEKSLNRMVRYCKKDVIELKNVYTTLLPYAKHKSNRAVFEGNSKRDCPECTSVKTKRTNTRVSATGHTRVQLQCNDCGKYFTITEKQWIG